MKEQYYQTKIINWINSIGGHVVNGTYSKSGEADLQAGIPIELENKIVLIHVAIEVKTPKDYNRVMRGCDKHYNLIDKKPLKKHEPLQLAKLKLINERGGIGVIASDKSHVIAKIKESFNYNN